MGFPTIDLMRTGANIVRLRKAAGLTVHDLQMVFGFNSPQAIYKWQNGAALPTVDMKLLPSTMATSRSPMRGKQLNASDIHENGNATLWHCRFLIAFFQFTVY